MQSPSAAAPGQLAPPPPPPTSFASNTNLNGGSSSAASSTLNQLETSILSSIGDVFTYQPSGGGAIESAAPVGPPTTALTVKNGESLHSSGLAAGCCLLHACRHAASAAIEGGFTSLATQAQYSQ